MFYIPETQEEIKALIKDIIERNQGGAALEILYAVNLTEALYNKEEEKKGA